MGPPVGQLRELTVSKEGPARTRPFAAATAAAHRPDPFGRVFVAWEERCQPRVQRVPGGLAALEPEEDGGPVAHQQLERARLQLRSPAHQTEKVCVAVDFVRAQELFSGLRGGVARGLPRRHHWRASLH